MTDNRYTLTVRPNDSAVGMAIPDGVAKGGAPYGGSFTSGTGNPLLDAYGKQRSPSAYDLIRENLGTAAACAQLNASLVAKTTLRLYVKRRKGDKPSRMSQRGETKALNTKRMERLEKVASPHVRDAVEVEEVTVHPVLDLLSNPNAVSQDGAGIGGYELFETTQAYQEVVGRAYWYIERGGLGNTPSAIWILPAQLIQQRYGTTDDEPLITGYWLTGSLGNQDYSPEEIIPFRVQDLYAPYTGGQSPLRKCFEQAKIPRYADAATLARLLNGGKPDAVWSPMPNGDMGGFLGDNEAVRAEEAFRQAFGRAGQGGIFVQRYAGKLEPLSWPMNDIIDAARLELDRKIIANCYDVPVTMLDDTVSTLAAAQVSQYKHANLAGIPRLHRNADTLTKFLVPMYGEDAAERMFFAYDDPPGLRDPAQEFEQSKGGVASGSITRNEMRALLNLEEVPWGNLPLVPNTMTAVDPVTGKPDVAKPVVPPTDPAEKPEAPDVGKMLADAIAPHFASLGRRIGKIDRRQRKLANQTNGNSGTGAGVSGLSDRAGDRDGVTHRAVAGDPVRASEVINPTDDGLAHEYLNGAMIEHGARDVFRRQRAELLAAIAGHVEKRIETDKERDERQKREEEALLLLLLAWDFDTAEWNQSVSTATVHGYQSIVHRAGTQTLIQISQRASRFNLVQGMSRFEHVATSTATRLSTELGPQINKTTTEQLHEGIRKVQADIAEAEARKPGVEVPTPTPETSEPVDPADVTPEPAKPSPAADVTSKPVTVEPIAETPDETLTVKARVQIAVDELFDKADTERAKLIGENEAVKAESTGSGDAVKVAKEQNVDIKKRWRCQPGACDVCLSYQAVGWVPEDFEYEGGVTEPPDPHVACRCDLERRVL